MELAPAVGGGLDLQRRSRVLPLEARSVHGQGARCGPAIGIGANFTMALWELMIGEAEEKGIPYQREGVPSQSGTDAWALQVLRGGTISGLVSIPNRYMHSANEVISLSDLRNVGRLLAATVRALGKSDLKHTVEVFRKGS